MRFDIVGPVGNFTALTFAGNGVILDNIIRTSADLSFIRPSDPLEPNALDLLYLVIIVSESEDRLPKRLGAYDVLMSLTYHPPSSRPSTYNLCILLIAVGALTSVYKMDGTQLSFWFSHTVFTSLHRVFPCTDMILGPNAWLKGRLVGFPIDIIDSIDTVCMEYQQVHTRLAKQSFQDEAVGNSLLY